MIATKMITVISSISIIISIIVVLLKLYSNNLLYIKITTYQMWNINIKGAL